MVEGKKNREPKVQLFSSMDADSVLTEARFALGKSALYANKTASALELFSQVNTPQALWNQVQVCAFVDLHLASTELLAGRHTGRHTLNSWHSGARPSACTCTDQLYSCRQTYAALNSCQALVT